MITSLPNLGDLSLVTSKEKIHELRHVITEHINACESAEAVGALIWQYPHLVPYGRL